MDSPYDVCFAGELLEGQELPAVRLRLAKLFNANEATLDKLFSGKTQYVKRGCDRETALKYKKAMERAGAKPIIRGGADTAGSPAQTSGASSAQRIAALAAGQPAGKTETGPGTQDPEASPGQAAVEDGMDLAPAGSEILRPEERVEPQTPDIDTSAMEVMASGARLSDGLGEPPPAPDTSHLSVGEVGDTIPTLPPSAEPLSPDISGISLSPENTDFSDCAPPPATPPQLDLSGMNLAPSGADMLEEEYRAKEDAQAPATDHLQLDE